MPSFGESGQDLMPGAGNLGERGGFGTPEAPVQQPASKVEDVLGFQWHLSRLLNGLQGKMALSGRAAPGS